MEIPKAILDDIADSMEAGFNCFLDKVTHEIVTYLDPDSYPDMDFSIWKEEISKVKKTTSQ